MNFQDLLTKIKKLDENPLLVPDDDIGESPADQMSGAGAGDECMDNNPKAVLPSGDDDILTGECGGMMDVQTAPKQSDSVTMNVSMNGSGAGGIKDLLDIIRNIQGSGEHNSDDILVGIGAEENFDDATTRPNPKKVPVPDSGDDLHREKDEYKKANGGGNPMRMHETLVAKLSAKYNEIKGQ
jgi:hypothetical protein